MLVIRRYRPGDRAAVHRIAADTAWFGAPVEAFLEDRRLFLDAVYEAYTRFEPEHIWVATLDDEVAGFILGAADTTRHRQHSLRVFMSTLIWRMLRGQYRIGPKTLAYARGIIGATLRDEWIQADLRRYPAHLHINMDPRWRGRGGGRLLLGTFLEAMRQEGVRGVHLRTTDQNRAACRLYESVGFALIDERATRLWAGATSRPVRNRCYALDLHPAFGDNELKQVPHVQRSQ